MQRLVNLNLAFSLEVAEGVLYERAVNGFMEEVYVDGKKVGEKKKFSSNSKYELCSCNENF